MAVLATGPTAGEALAAQSKGPDDAPRAEPALAHWWAPDCVNAGQFQEKFMFHELFTLHCMYSAAS